MTQIARTVRTLRQHEAVPGLLRAALARCQREVAALLTEGPLTIELHAGQVRCEDQLVLRFGPSDVPFGRLVDAGVGEVVLAHGTTPDQIERLVQICAAAPGPSATTFDLAAALRAGDLPGVHLRPPSPARQSGRADGPGIDWWLLPEPLPQPAVGAAIERDLDTNAASGALRILLDDLAAGNLDEAPGPLLEGLLDAMLAQGDAVGTGYLLEQAEHRAEIPADVGLRLRRRALQAYDGAWLLVQLEDEHHLQGLVSLGLQLGNECIDRLALAAHAAGVPLPPFLSSLLPPGE